MRLFSILTFCLVLSACAGSTPRRGVAAVIPHCGVTAPTVLDTVVVEVGRTNQQAIRRSFGEPEQSEAGPGLHRYRWFYHPSVRIQEHRGAGAWTFELLSCRLSSGPGFSSGMSVEFTFDQAGRVVEVDVHHRSMPLDYD